MTSLRLLRFATAGLFFACIQTAAASFSDVPSNHPNADAIAYVKTQGIVEGYADGTYRPDQTINRAEFVKIVMETIDDLEHMKNCGTNIQILYADTPFDAWYFPYVCQATFEPQIIAGYPDHTFRPANAINFVEAAKIITGAKGLASDWGGGSEPWYRNYVEALENRHAIPTSIFSFDHNITRGEMAEIMYRIEAGVTDKPSKSFEELMDTTYVTIYLYTSAEDDGSCETIFGCDNLFLPVNVPVPKTTAVLKASLQALFDFNKNKEGCYDEKCSVSSAFGLSDLKVTYAAIVNGIARVNIEGQVVLYGDLTPILMMEQIERTVMQFDSVKSMEITVNGQPLHCIDNMSDAPCE